MVGMGQAPIPVKLVKKITDNEFCGIGCLIVHQSLCSRLRAPVIFEWKGSDLQEVPAG